MSHRPQPNLLVVAGMRAHRYVAGKRVPGAVDIDPESPAPIGQIKTELDQFRLNGFPPETADASESSDAVVVRDAGPEVFKHMARDLVRDK